MNDVTHLVKFVILGDHGVGKTSIIRRLMYDEFEKDVMPSMGSEFYSHHFSCSRSFKVQFWDTAGGDKYANNRQIYYLGASIFFIVYDICDETALERIPQWLKEIRWENGGTEFKEEGAIACLVGNKLDMNHMRKVSEDEASDLAKEHGMLHFQVSAKSGRNVKFAFEKIIQSFDELDANHRKAGGRGITQILNYSDFEDSCSDENIWIEYDGRKRLKNCCILL